MNGETQSFRVKTALHSHCDKVVSDPSMKVSVQAIHFLDSNGDVQFKMGRLVHTKDQTPLCDHAFSLKRLVNYLQHKSPDAALCSLCNHHSKSPQINLLIGAGGDKKRERNHNEGKEEEEENEAGREIKRLREEIKRLREGTNAPPYDDNPAPLREVYELPGKGRYQTPQVSVRVQWTTRGKTYETLQLSPEMDRDVFNVLKGICRDRQVSHQLDRIWLHYDSYEGKTQSAPLTVVLLLNKSKQGVDTTRQIEGFAMYSTKVYDTPHAKEHLVKEALENADYLITHIMEDDESELSEEEKKKIANACEVVYKKIRTYYSTTSQTTLTELQSRCIKALNQDIGEDLFRRMDYDAELLLEWIMQLWTHNESTISEWKYKGDEETFKTVEAYMLVFHQQDRNPLQGVYEKAALKHMEVSINKMVKMLESSMIPVSHAYVSVPYPNEHYKLRALQNYGFRMDDRERAFFRPGLVSPNVARTDSKFRLGVYTAIE